MKVHVRLEALFLPHSHLRLYDGVIEAESTVDAVRQVLKLPVLAVHLKELPNKSLRCEAWEVKP